jgi:cell division protein FtsL
VSAPARAPAHGPTRTLDRDGPRLTGRAAFLLVVVAFLGVVLLVPARQFLEQRSRIAELERETTRLEQQNADLQTEIAKLHDPAELERLARACLGLVKPGEIALVTPGEAPPADC